MNHDSARGARARARVGIAAAGAALLLLSGCSGAQASAAGSWGSDAPGEPMLLLGDDGSLSGTDGCNRLAGEWTADDDGGIDFGNVAVTKMACDGVDDWLSGLATGEVRGGKLHVFNEAGDEIGSLAHENEAKMR